MFLGCHHAPIQRGEAQASPNFGTLPYARFDLERPNWVRYGNIQGKGACLLSVTTPPSQGSGVLAFAKKFWDPLLTPIKRPKLVWGRSMFLRVTHAPCSQPNGAGPKLPHIFGTFYMRIDTVYEK